MISTRICNASSGKAHIRHSLREGVDNITLSTPSLFAATARLPRRRCLLLLVHVHVLGVDHAFVLLLRQRAGSTASPDRRALLQPPRCAALALYSTSASLWLAWVSFSCASFNSFTDGVPSSSFFDSASAASTSRLVGGLHFFAGVLQHLLDVVDQRRRASCAPRSPRAFPCPRRRAPRLPWPSSPLRPCSGRSSK